MFCLCD
jgi:AP-2 complex subunit alpha